MIKDRLLKMLLVPLLGIFIPTAAGIFSFSLPGPTLLFSFAFFTVAFILCWQCCVFIVGYIRRQSWFMHHAYRKLFMLPLLSSLAGALIYFVFLETWLHYLELPGALFREQSLFLVEVVMILLSLIYEIIFLSAERALDTIVLKQVDQERVQAEMSILKNELDPHFFFNCLTTLTQLVHLDAHKAYDFIYRLSSVYKYFLVNKEKDLVTLKEELEFLDNYFYLLQVRFENSIRLEYALDRIPKETKMPPCTLQVLVENAIKHNFFSEKEPLLVRVAASRHQLVVSNPIRPKLYTSHPSTHIGLKNLELRYRIILNKNIIIQKVQNQFSVTLPVLKYSEL